MKESAEQMPVLTQTGSGGKRMAKKPRKMSVEHIVVLVVLCNQDAARIQVQRTGNV